MLLTAPTAGNEELDDDLIGARACIRAGPSTWRGRLQPPAAHDDGHPDLAFEPKRFLHNYLFEKAAGLE